MLYLPAYQQRPFRPVNFFSAGAVGCQKVVYQPFLLLPPSISVSASSLHGYGLNRHHAKPHSPTLRDTPCLLLRMPCLIQIPPLYSRGGEVPAVARTNLANPPETLWHAPHSHPPVIANLSARRKFWASPPSYRHAELLAPITTLTGPLFRMAFAMPVVASATSAA